MQIVDAIPADLIYGEADTYTTGFQQPRHLEDLITTVVARQDPARAIDVGCNDGSLLEALRPGETVLVLCRANVGGFAVGGGNIGRP